MGRSLDRLVRPARLPLHRMAPSRGLHQPLPRQFSTTADYISDATPIESRTCSVLSHGCSGMAAQEAGRIGPGGKSRGEGESRKLLKYLYSTLLHFLGPKGLSPTWLRANRLPHTTATIHHYFVTERLPKRRKSLIRHGIDILYDSHS